MEDGGNGKENKSWTELKKTLCELRRQLSALSTVVPTSISFKKYADGSIRIFFLGTFSNGWETTLHYADIPADETRYMGRLHWQQLLEFNFQTTPLIGVSSREEQLMFERKRLTTWGITSYELHAESGKIVFPAAGTLYQCTDNPFKNSPLFPSELRTNSNGAKLAPLICPSNKDLIAYISNCDIWVSHEASGTSERLTYSHRGGRSLADDPLSSGTPSYVIQEEFNRYQGCWWQPQSKDGLYRLLYEEVDDSEVGLFTFPSSVSPVSADIELFRFPRAGTANSKSNIKLIELMVNDTEILRTRTLELQHPLSTMFPWMEYVVRAGWTPDSEHIWIQLLDRRQKRLELVIISLESFVEPPPNVFRTDKPLDNLTPPAQVVVSQISDVWINVHDLLYILPDSEGGRVKLIWGSEETGFRHLYLITTQPYNYTNGVEETIDGNEVRCRSNKMALTCGDWEVLGSDLWVDVDRGLVYFMGLRDTPLEKHLYVVSLHQPCDIRLLTAPGYSYTIDINEDCTVCVAVYSNIENLPVCTVFRITHTDLTVDGVQLLPIGYLLEPRIPEKPVHSPQLFNHQISSGDTLYAMVFKPHNYLPGQTYPTVLHVYGGPEVQLVSNTFKDMRYLRMHMLASQGYCVIAIDSRGSQHRGLTFESHIKDRMGTVELKDQLEVLKWLASELGIIDLSRVGILGWSYGGYLSLMALAQYPDIFKVAVAGAPVTSWFLYDTGYTERYMDLPENNPHGYKHGSILSYVNQFPDEENRLLIIHGLIDDNVHFTHTSTLVSHLIRKGKPYQLQVYPTERHSLRSLDASKHYETMLLSFLQKNL